METKLAGLSRLNVRALREVFPEAVTEGALELTATTATFHGRTPAEARAEVEAVVSRLTMRGHPRHSLHAVVRRLRAAEELEDLERVRRQLHAGAENV